MARPFMKRRARSSQPIMGADRRGVQGDLAAALDRSREGEDPRVERPAVMIRTLRYLGGTEGSSPAEAMTAKAHALYEYLMASARLEITTKTEHRVSFADAKAYLSVDRNDRIREYVDAIGRTWVSYDFVDSRDGVQRTGKMQLLHCEEVVDPSGNRHIVYSMHPSIRKVILEAREYTHLEINAFPRFKCKYSPRLYPRLALTAGMDVQKPLVYTPEQLADDIGWDYRGKVHFGHFESRCLKPMMDDFSFGIRRFFADYELRRATTRGWPVEAIIFTVSRSQKKLEEEKKATVVSLDRHRLRRHIEKSGLDRARETPNEEIMAQAATRLGMSIVEVSGRWVEALQRAKADPDAFLGAHRRNTGGYVLNLLQEKGVAKAFKEWLIDYEMPSRAYYPVPGQPGIVVTEKPSATVTEKPRELREVDIFDEARVIQFELDDSLSLETIQTEILARVDRYTKWEGAEQKTLRFKWIADGVVGSRDYEVQLGWVDTSRLLHAFKDMLKDCRWMG